MSESQKIRANSWRILFFGVTQEEEFEPLMEVFYWRDYHQREVDFIIKEGNVKQLIQVTYELTPENEKREINNLLKASKELKCDNLLNYNLGSR